MLGIEFAFTACAYMSPNGRASVYSTESCWFKSSHYPKGIAQRLNAIGLSVIFGLHEPVWSGICLEHKRTRCESGMYPKGLPCDTSGLILPLLFSLHVSNTYPPG